MANYLSPFMGDGSGSSRSLAESFVRIVMSGSGELDRKIRELSDAASTSELRNSLRSGMNVIKKAYKSNLPIDVTGNLRKSVSTKTKAYSSGVVAGIVGPTHVVAGKEWDVETKGAGNHAWLVEFGTKRRRPGTKNRRTYINIHRSINGKMTRHRGSNDTDFLNASRGYYFIMSSFDEKTRKARQGSGYPHDYIQTLHPGETYAGVTPSNSMQKAIQSSSGNARAALEAAVERRLKKYL